jgi:hypothetical protein
MHGWMNTDLIPGSRVVDGGGYLVCTTLLVERNL